MKLKCLIADDEPLAIQIIENYLSRIEAFELVSTARNGVEAFNILQKQPIDVLFLDIEMPQLSGLQLVQNIPNPPKVIFTTAYRDYAVESYELNAVDYLVKPITFERFLKAVYKILNPNQIDETDSFIYLKADKKIFRIAIAHILYIESLKDYIIVHTIQEKIVSYLNISHIERVLPTDKFLRIHRSFLIALEHIHSYNASQVMIGQIELPIGRTYKDEVAKVLKID